MGIAPVPQRAVAQAVCAGRGFAEWRTCQGSRESSGCEGTGGPRNLNKTNHY